MPVKVDIVGNFRTLFERSSYTFDVMPDMRARDIFNKLSALAGPGYSKSIYDAKLLQMNEYITVFVNAKEIRSLEGMDTKLKDGDVITILPPMEGG